MTPASESGKKKGQSARGRAIVGDRHRDRSRQPLDSVAVVGWFYAGIYACPAPVAQGIERRFPKPCVAGSNPAGGTSTFALVSGPLPVEVHDPQWSNLGGIRK